MPSEIPAIKTTPTESKSPKKEAVQLTATELSSLEKGKKEWNLTSKNISLNEKTRKAYAVNLICVFYNPDSKPFITLKAKAAFIDLNTQSLEFSGRVKADSDAGDRITINKLLWDGKEKKLLGSGGVTITKIDGSRITGENLIAVPSEKKIEIKNNVRINLKKAESLFEKQ